MHATQQYFLHACYATALLTTRCNSDCSRSTELCGLGRYGISLFECGAAPFLLSWALVQAGCLLRYQWQVCVLTA